jgi:hypothetical protein
MNHHLENKSILQPQTEKSNTTCLLLFREVQNMVKSIIKKIIMRLWHRFINLRIIVNLW